MTQLVLKVAALMPNQPTDDWCAAASTASRRRRLGLMAASDDGLATGRSRLGDDAPRLMSLGRLEACSKSDDDDHGRDGCESAATSPG